MNSSGQQRRRFNDTSSWIGYVPPQIRSDSTVACTISTHHALRNASVPDPVKLDARLAQLSSDAMRRRVDRIDAELRHPGATDRVVASALDFDVSPALPPPQHPVPQAEPSVAPSAHLRTRSTYTDPVPGLSRSAAQLDAYRSPRFVTPQFSAAGALSASTATATSSVSMAAAHPPLHGAAPDMHVLMQLRAGAAPRRQGAWNSGKPA